MTTRPPTGVVLSVDVATVAEDVASDGGTAPTVTVTAMLAGSVTFTVDQTVTVTVGKNSDTATSVDYAAVGGVRCGDHRGNLDRVGVFRAVAG